MFENRRKIEKISTICWHSNYIGKLDNGRRFFMYDQGLCEKRKKMNKMANTVVFNYLKNKKMSGVKRLAKKLREEVPVFSKRKVPSFQEVIKYSNHLFNSSADEQDQNRKETESVSEVEAKECFCSISHDNGNSPSEYFCVICKPHPSDWKGGKAVQTLNLKGIQELDSLSSSNGNLEKNLLVQPKKPPLPNKTTSPSSNGKNGKYFLRLS